MTTKQTDTVAMTEEQLDTVVGGVYAAVNVRLKHSSNNVLGQVAVKINVPPRASRPRVGTDASFLSIHKK